MLLHVHSGKQYVLVFYMTNATEALPLVSVIIPTYNYANFLSKAIESVLRQTYCNVEIIVVDDGSADDTQRVVEQYSTVKYFYQRNKGLAAARNNGIRQSGGDYLVFLDADDWFEKDALEKNYMAIKDKPHIAFVSGSYYFLRAATNKLYDVSVTVTDHHYIHLLQSNYIGMHATVMFQRWVFDAFRYDETLKACEDYDLYLHVARQHPVLHHQHFIATYYFHSSGLSHNYQAMIDSIKTVMKKQLPHIRSAEEQRAYIKGLEQWKEYYQLMESIAVAQ